MNVGFEGLIAHAAQRPCVICGGAPDVVGLYFAEGDAARRIGAAPGKTRVVPYSLCENHPLNAETATKAEELLEAFLAAESPTIFTPSDATRRGHAHSHRSHTLESGNTRRGR